MTSCLSRKSGQGAQTPMMSQKLASPGAGILFCDGRRGDCAPSEGTVPAMAGKYEAMICYPALCSRFSRGMLRPRKVHFVYPACRNGRLFFAFY